MKKITLMLIAAFMAVVSWAGAPVQKGDFTPKKERAQVQNLKMAPAQKVTPKMVAPFKGQLPATAKPMAKKMKAGVRKAASKATAADFVQLLSKDYMLVSEYYEYTQQGPVVATPAAGATPIKFSVADMASMSVAIQGIKPFGYEAEEEILATVELATDAELLADGVVATATIAMGQTLFVDEDYGSVVIENFTEEGKDIIAYIYDDGYVEFDSPWYDALGEDGGQYAGYMYTGLINDSFVTPVNATMTWVWEETDDQGNPLGNVDQEAKLVVLQDPDSPKEAIVFNFAGMETAVSITMKADKSFIIPEQVMAVSSSYGDITLSGIDSSNYLCEITGVGTDNTLTADCKFCTYISYGGKLYVWDGFFQPFTITLLEESFTYPEPEAGDGGVYTFDFNSMDVATSNNAGATDGDITEDVDIKEGGVTLTVSTSGGKTPNRFWSTNNGPQLRVYGGTLTFTADGDEPITKIEFYHNGKWGEDNTADSGELVNDADKKVATWTGEAKTVVVTIAANTQIDNIVVTVGASTEPSELDELVVLPEGLETEVWTIEGKFEDSMSADNIVRRTEVAFDGNDVYVKGIPFYFEEAWMKGTLDEYNFVTFPSGQFVGEDEYGKEYMVGTEDGETVCDIKFYYNAEEKTLEQITDYIAENGHTRDEVYAYGWWYNMIIYKGEPIIVEPVEVPEGLETSTYLFSAMEYIDNEDDEDDENASRKAEVDEGIEIDATLQPYSYQIEVGVDGKDVYFQGFTEDTNEFWAKGTLSDDGKTVTIPANQYLGQLAIIWFTFDYYLTAVGTDLQTMEDIVLTFDADKKTFSTNQIVTLHDGKRALGKAYQTFTDIEIEKMNEFAATPADPSVSNFGQSFGFYKVNCDIPVEDVDGNALIGSKLSYVIWIEKDGIQQQLTLKAGEDGYTKLEEDMTEIPYKFTDNYDIYAGGDPVYLNFDEEELQSWTKIGVQSIYYGAGECNKSNIGWYDLMEYWIAVAINEVKAGDTVVYYDMQGRVANASQKGLLIKQIRKADGTVKTVKVIRK